VLNGHPSPTRSAVGGIGLIIAIILIVGIGWAWGYGGHGWGTWWNRNKSNHAANMAPHAGAPIAAVMPPRAPLASAQDQTQVPPQVPAQLQAQAPAQDQSLAPPQVQSQVPAATQSVAQQSQDNAGPADANCPGHPGALGTSRLLSLDPAQHPRVGHMQYPDSLPLNDEEVVLTFDDGPSPRYSNEILDILASQCVKATYFMVGEMARAYCGVVVFRMSEIK